jgi:SAM-dependent methyltransferase
MVDPARRTAQVVNWDAFSPFRTSISCRGLGTTHLDLGCGLGPKNPFACDQVTGLDLLSREQVCDRFGLSNDFSYVEGDLLAPLPFPDDAFTSVSAYDVVEHVPRYHLESSGQVTNAFINLMNEIYRILQPGGVFLAVTPAFPSGAAFQDPTHVNFITIRTLGYFSGPEPLAQSLGYGFSGRFRTIYQGWMRSGQLHKSAVSPMKGNSAGEAAQPQEGRGLGSLLKRARGRTSMALRPTHLIWLIQAEK